MPTHTDIFIYGTLLNPLVRLVVCRQRISITMCTLKGFRKVGRNIVPDSQATVSGGIITVSKNILVRLDQYERVPHKYRRERILILERPVYVYLKNLDK